LDIIQKRLVEIAAIKNEETLLPPVTKPVNITTHQINPVKEAMISSEEVVIPDIVEKKKEQAARAGKHSFTQWLKTIQKEPPAEMKREEQKPGSASSADEIISRFIETEPRIVPSKAEFYNPLKAAKQSLEEHDDLVSETLAGIFAQQGNIQRAIDMYKKLLLLRPEKSTLFAARIQELTEQLNSGK
jgi:hypothetical protein